VKPILKYKIWVIGAFYSLHAGIVIINPLLKWFIDENFVCIKIILRCGVQTPDFGSQRWEK
jgi:hypothetical protein